MPTVYGYARVSHRKSLDRDNSIPAQQDSIRKFYEDNLTSIGPLEIHSEERAVSAWKVPFHQRPTGKRLYATLGAGDVLLVDRIDRLWRRVSDFSSLVDTLNARGTTLHIANFMGSSVNMSSGLGKFLLTIMVAFAELESDMKSERITEAIHKSPTAHDSQRRSKAHAKMHGLIFPPEGGVQWDPNGRKILQICANHYDSNKSLRNSAVNRRIEKEIAALERRAPRPFEKIPEVSFSKSYNRYATYKFLGFWHKDTPPQWLPLTDTIAVIGRRQYRRQLSHQQPTMTREEFRKKFKLPPESEDYGA